MAAAVTAEAEVDGRRARRERGRQAVVDAMVDLIQKGCGLPTPEAVAEQAGVSVASLFRYFPTLDDLRAQVSARVHDRFAEHFEIPRMGEGPLPRRVDRFARARVALWEAIAPISRLTRARAYDHPPAADLLRKMQRQLADQAAMHFAPELAGRTPAAAADLIALITTATSFEAWDMLLHDFDRSPAQIVRVWCSALQALLAPTSDGALRAVSPSGHHRLQRPTPGARIPEQHL